MNQPHSLIVGAFLVVALAGCNQNTAGGNDREAALDPAPAAAPIEGAGEALRNVEVASIKPVTMTEADVQAIGGIEGRCVFAFTEVGFPAFVYEPGERGFLKLNGKLVPVAADGPARYVSDTLIVVTRPVEGTGDAGLQEADLIVIPPGAKDELGYRGYLDCEPRDGD